MSEEQNKTNVDENLTVGEVSEQSSNKMPDETLREFLRGDATKGDADNRDVAGDSEYKDTPQGREEAKADKERES